MAQEAADKFHSFKEFHQTERVSAVRLQSGSNPTSCAKISWIKKLALATAIWGCSTCQGAAGCDGLIAMNFSSLISNHGPSVRLGVLFASVGNSFWEAQSPTICFDDFDVSFLGTIDREFVAGWYLQVLPAFTIHTTQCKPCVPTSSSDTG